MTILAIDIETYSSVDLVRSGVYAYSASPDFEILLIGYAFDDEPVRVIDLASGEELPAEVLKALNSPSIIKSAYNANFERTCLAAYLKRPMPPEQWQCSSVHALTLGLPGHLDTVAKALKAKQQKDSAGKALIRYFSMPCKPTKANGGRTRNLPEHDPKKWEQYKAYNAQDVETERELRTILSRYPVRPEEWELWELDQEINDRGVAVDVELVRQAVACDTAHQEELYQEAQELTGLGNPNSVAQLKGWVEAATGEELESLNKATVKELKEETECSTVKKVLSLRQRMAKTSVKKYEAMERALCPDGRVRGMFQFYGANRTGRWAGRLINLQNLPRNSLVDLDLARQLLKSGDFELLELLYESVPNVLSQLIRTALIPAPGYRFIVADFSAIEARVIAWLAKERWRMDVFASHGKIYEASAAHMFKVPIEEITKDSPLRQKGKIAELACIAQGQRVLTDKGLIPIEEVTCEHRVWDGTEFVTHQGVVYRGVKEVIQYAGLTATPDHIVWIWKKGQPWPVRFENAAASGARLIQTGNGGQTLRLGRNNQPGKTLEQELESRIRIGPMREMWRDTMDAAIQPHKREVKRMSNVLSTTPSTQVVGPTTYSGQTAVHKPKRSKLRKLRCPRNRISIHVCVRGRALDIREPRTPSAEHGVRSDRQQRTLRARKFTLCNKRQEPSQQKSDHATRMGPQSVALCQKCRHQKTSPRYDPRADIKGRKTGGTRKTQELAGHCQTTKKARVYDILNAGPRNRFTVANYLVHNCGYGGGVGALKAMGALEMGLEESELPGLIKDWRTSNPNITQFWWTVGDAAMKAIQEKTTVLVHYGIEFSYEAGDLFLQLPSGRRLCYVRPRIETGKFGRPVVTYEGSEQGQWTRIDTYGPKLVENIVQATARDCLAEAMMRLDAAGYKIVMHVHDEVVLEMPIGKGSLEEACSIMGQPLEWAPGLLLSADGFETEYYKKD